MYNPMGSCNTPVRKCIQNSLATLTRHIYVPLYTLKSDFGICIQITHTANSMYF